MFNVKRRYSWSSKKLIFYITNNVTYRLRSNDRKQHLNKSNTDFMKKSFSYRAAFAWNNLPCDVVSDYESLSTTRFKNLINNYFKNLEDCNWQYLQDNISHFMTLMFEFWSVGLCIYRLIKLASIVLFVYIYFSNFLELIFL
jgi:hypothetical protein